MTAMTQPVDVPENRPSLWNRFLKARGPVYCVLAVIGVVWIFPFVWMALGSVKTQREILAIPPKLLPEHATLENFTVPSVATFVPLFVVVSNMGLSNTYAALILPFLTQPIGVFLMRQFIAGIPDALMEAARIDGAGELRIFFQIILPQCGPAMATLAILTFLSSWNNFLWPLVAAQTDDMYTLPVALSLYSTGQNATNYSVLLAGAVLIITPILLLFVFLQRYFIQGVAMTGIK